MIPIRRPWTTQPQTVAGVNWANPATNGMFSCVLPATKMEIVRGTVLDGDTTRTVGATHKGLALRSTAGKWCLGPFSGGAFGSRGVYSYNTTPGSVSGNFSVLSVCVRPSGERDLDGNPAIYAMASTTQGAALTFPVQWISGNTYVELEANSIELVFSSSLGAVIEVGDVFAVLSAYTFGVGTAWYLCNLSRGFTAEGELSMTVTPYEGYADSSRNIIGIGNSSSTVATSRIDVLADARWRSLVSPNIARSLVRNPWQLFAPRRIWIPVSVAAAAVAPTLTAAIAHNLGSTTVTPRVTFTR